MSRRRKDEPGDAPAAAAPRPRSAALSILHLDRDLVVIDKPPNLLSVPARDDEPNVVDLLRGRAELADNPAVRVVHRIDRDASGLLVLARTLEAQQDLVRQFMERSVEKEYLALVSGFVVEDGAVDLPLLIDPRKPIARVSSRGKPSRTTYRIVQRVAGHTLLACCPITGRMHQIRAHLAAIEFPLAVDPLYGGGAAIYLSHFKPRYRPSRKHEERPLIDRLTLHAARIQFVHPATGETVTFESPLPKDFRAAINQLSRLT